MPRSPRQKEVRPQQEDIAFGNEFELQYCLIAKLKIRYK